MKSADMFIFRVARPDVYQSCEITFYAYRRRGIGSRHSALRNRFCNNGFNPSLVKTYISTR